MPGGRYGTVKGVSTVEQWNLTDTKTADSYVATNTGTGTMRSGGVRQWSGGFNGRGYLPPVQPNETLAFDGFTTPDTGVEGTAGTSYVGNVIINQVVINWNWAANQVYPWTAAFNGQPGLTINPAGTSTLDTSIPSVDSPCGINITYSDGVVTDEPIPAAVSAAWTLSASLATESNSSNFVNSECWMSYSPGPLDWTLSIPQEDYQRGLDGYPDLGDTPLELKLWVNATDYWLVNYGQMEEYSNLVVDINTGATIARTMNISMKAHNGTDLGRIVVPGGSLTEQTDFWFGIADTP